MLKLFMVLGATLSSSFAFAGNTEVSRCTLDGTRYVAMYIYNSESVVLLVDGSSTPSEYGEAFQYLDGPAALRSQPAVDRAAKRLAARADDVRSAHVYTLSGTGTVDRYRGIVELFDELRTSLGVVFIEGSSERLCQ